MATLLKATTKVSRPDPKVKLDITTLARAVFNGIDPKITIPRATLAPVNIPAWIRENMPAEKFIEAMAYPEFDVPMYKPLLDISAELFLPNINFVTENSISLLETNQKFIEAYMVGLNHEFARELLWREYTLSKYPIALILISPHRLLGSWSYLVLQNGLRPKALRLGFLTSQFNHEPKNNSD